MPDPKVVVLSAERVLAFAKEHGVYTGWTEDDIYTAALESRLILFANAIAAWVTMANNQLKEIRMNQAIVLTPKMAAALAENVQRSMDQKAWPDYWQEEVAALKAIAEGDTVIVLKAP